MNKYHKVLLLVPIALFLASCGSNQASPARVAIASSTTVTIPAPAAAFTKPTSTTIPPCKNPNPPGHLCYQATPPNTRTTITAEVPTTSAVPTATDKLGASLEATQIIIEENSTSNPSPAEVAYFGEFNINCGQDTTSAACIAWLDNNPPPLGGFPASNATTTVISSSCGWNISTSECMAIIKKHQSESSP